MSQCGEIPDTERGVLIDDPKRSSYDGRFGHQFRRQADSVMPQQPH